MKKCIARMLSILFISLCLTSCKEGTVETVNGIAPKKLTEGQEEIVKLLSINNQEILLFEYKTEQEYKDVEVWVDTYEKGILVDNIKGVKSSTLEKRPLDAQLAVTINQNPNFEWRFTVLNSDGIAINGAFEQDDSDYELSRGFGAIDDAVTIESGKEIVLYVSFFSNGELPMYEDFQRYAEQPELLKEYDYAQILKCKFD